VDVPASSQRGACVENVRLRLCVVLCSCAQNKLSQPTTELAPPAAESRHLCCVRYVIIFFFCALTRFLSFGTLSRSHEYISHANAHASHLHVSSTQGRPAHTSHKLSRSVAARIQTRDAHRSLSSARHDGIEKIIASTSCGRRWASRARCCHCRARSCDGQP
jgi:hypothetical protein